VNNATEAPEVLDKIPAGVQPPTPDHHVHLVSDLAVHV
jgi:hypothetical protein